MSDARVTIEQRDSVAWITIDRPEKLNALAGDMRDRLKAHIVEAANDEQVRSLVVTGAGSAFCAGGDVATMVKLHENGDEAGFRALLRAGVEVVLAVQAFPGLTVAAIGGVAAGAGLSLAMACDIRVAVESATFGASWGRIGLAPDWGASFWLPHLVGSGRALELALTGRLVPATEARSIGLVHQIVADGELGDTVQRMATEIGARPHAVAQTKALLRAAVEDSFEHALAREVEAQEACFRSEDFEEGLGAFLQKKESRFSGE